MTVEFLFNFFKKNFYCPLTHVLPRNTAFFWTLAGKPAVLSWLDIVCQHWLMPTHSQLHKLYTYHSCRTGVSPMRQMIPHYHTQHNSSFSTPLPRFLIRLLFSMVIIARPYCSSNLSKIYTLRSQSVSFVCLFVLYFTHLIFSNRGLCVLKWQGLLPPTLILRNCVWMKTCKRPPC